MIKEEGIRKGLSKIQKVNPNLSILIFFSILVLIIKSIIVLKYPPFFNLGEDVPRHIALIQRTVLNGHVQYFHPDGSPGAYVYYPPGLHFLISELKLLTGCRIEDIFIFMSIFAFIFFICLSYILTKKIAGKREGILALFISSLFLPIPNLVPFTICIYVFFPIILFAIISYFKNEKNLKILLVLSLLTLGLGITHFSYSVLLLITSFIVVLFFIFVQKKIVSTLNVWIVTIYSCISAFILYTLFTPDLSTAIKLYTLSFFYKDLPLISSLINNHPLLLLSISMLLPAFIYFILKYRKPKIKSEIILHNRINKFLPKIFIPYQAFFFIALIVSILLNLSNLSMIFLVEPTISFFAREIVINSVSYVVGLQKAALFTFLSLAIYIPTLYLFTITALKNKYEKLKETDLILISFILIPLVLMPLALFHNSFLSHSLFAARLPLYGIIVTIVYSSLFFEKLGQGNKFGKAIKISILLVFLSILVFSAINSPILHHQEKGLNQGYQWLIDNTDIYVDERSYNPYHDVLYFKFKPMISYEAKGYYHLSEFPTSYKSNLFDMQIKLIQNEQDEYTPLLKIGKKTIYLENIKWKPFIPSGLANKDYSNDKIAFYNLKGE